MHHLNKKTWASHNILGPDFWYYLLLVQNNSLLSFLFWNKKHRRLQNCNFFFISQQKNLVLKGISSNRINIANKDKKVFLEVRSIFSRARKRETPEKKKEAPSCGGRQKFLFTFVFLIPERFHWRSLCSQLEARAFGPRCVRKKTFFGQKQKQTHVLGFVRESFHDLYLNFPWCVTKNGLKCFETFLPN